MMSCYAVFRPTPPRDGVIAVPSYFTTLKTVKPAHAHDGVFYYEPNTRISNIQTRQISFYLIKLEFCHLCTSYVFVFLQFFFFCPTFLQQTLNRLCKYDQLVLEVQPWQQHHELIIVKLVCPTLHQTNYCPLSIMKMSKVLLFCDFMFYVSVMQLCNVVM